MKEERLFSWKQILIILILAGAVYGTAGNYGLSRWSRELEDHRARFLFSVLLAPARQISRLFHWETGAESLKNDFHRLKDRSFGEFARLGFSLPEKGGENTEAAGVNPDPGTIPRIPETSSPGEDFPSSGSAYSAVLPAPPAAAPEQPEIQPLRQEKLVYPPVPPGPPRGSLLLMGDSLANSCSTALVPMVDTLPELSVEKYGRVSANLANPVFDGWFDELGTVVQGKRFDAVLIMMGANAAQAMTQGERRIEYGLPEWDSLYRQRAGNLLSILKKSSDRIYWVGIPPMYKKTYRDNMLRQNTLIQEICRENGVQFIPIQFILGDEKGLYTDYKIIAGKQVRIRSNDRIHYTMAGGELLTRYILSELFPGNPFYQD